jgi:hypothetical protein
MFIVSQGKRVSKAVFEKDRVNLPLTIGKMLKNHCYHGKMPILMLFLQLYNIDKIARYGKRGNTYESGIMEKYMAIAIGIYLYIDYLYGHKNRRKSCH